MPTPNDATILDAMRGGDDEASREVSFDVLAEAGFSVEEIEAILGPLTDEAKKYIKSGFDPNQPRDRRGRWSETGGGDGEGTDAARDAARPDREDGRGVDRVLDAGFPDAFARGSDSGLEGGRGTVDGAEIVETFAPTIGQAQAWRTQGVTPLSFNELKADATGAQVFHDAIVSAKESSPYGAAVHAYDAADYQGMRLFLSPDKTVGFALKGDDIVSLFKHDKAKNSFKIATPVMTLAISQGGRRLDCFDTQLPKIYGELGFRSVARISFDPQYQPEGWSYDRFAKVKWTSYSLLMLNGYADVFKFNSGKPDVVFMVYDPRYRRPYQPGDGVRVASYDDGNDLQRKHVINT